MNKAILYEKYRLAYADGAVSELLERIDNIEIVADIGAGTGQLARLFAKRGLTVYAIEPDPDMLAVASTALANFPTIEIQAGYAEQNDLAQNSIDLIVLGNAFHRFKPEACQELRRILKKQGWIALFRYGFKNKAMGQMLAAKLATLSGLAKRVKATAHNPSMQRLFGNGRIHTLTYPQSHTEAWPEFFGAACAGMEAPLPGEPEFKQFEATYREIFKSFAVDGKLQIDYETRVAFGQPSIE